MNIQKPLISFDYAIKYLLKDKGDYEIVEGFLSALLRTQGYKDVKIIKLLESESLKEESISKKSIADVIVEDEDHQKYIIEIERNFTDCFIQKSCFNTSRLIVDNISQRTDFNQIIKVFHVSLLYFPIGNEAISFGKTLFHGVENHKPLVLEGIEMLPEYFVISIPLFNNTITSEIHEWLYVLRNDNVPDHFVSPYMEKVRKRLNFLKMSQSERDDYYNYSKKYDSEKNALRCAEEKGLAEGLLEGKIKEKIAIAKKMLSKNKSIEEIIEMTELTSEEVINLYSQK
jgi:predicted transposase/invertase (TIGR01784 family)